MAVQVMGNYGKLAQVIRGQGCRNVLLLKITGKAPKRGRKYRIFPIHPCSVSWFQLNWTKLYLPLLLLKRHIQNIFMTGEKRVSKFTTMLFNFLWN